MDTDAFLRTVTSPSRKPDPAGNAPTSRARWDPAATVIDEAGIDGTPLMVAPSTLRVYPVPT